MTQAAPLVTNIPGPIRGKGRPRASARGKFVRMYTPEATTNMEAHVRACFVSAHGQPVLEGPICMQVEISAEIPKTWSKRKRADALAGVVRPTGKPDLDNVLKLVADALNGIAFRDDSQITSVTASKRYAEKAETRLTIQAEQESGVKLRESVG